MFISVPFQNWRHILRDSQPLEKWDETFDRREGYRKAHRFYQWRLTRPELQRELELRGFRVHQIKPIAKNSGVLRLLQWELHWFKEGTAPHAWVRRILRRVLPSTYVSHMIMAVAQKSLDT